MLPVGRVGDRVLVYYGERGGFVSGVHQHVRIRQVELVVGVGAVSGIVRGRLELVKFSEQLIPSSCCVWARRKGHFMDMD